MMDRFLKASYEEAMTGLNEGERSKLPLTDLHVHLEGTLEPEMFFRLAKRNQVALPWNSPEALRRACSFRDLSGFLAIYFKTCEVLRTETDFYDLTHAYLERAAEGGVVHTEVFLGPQTFLAQGVPFKAIMDGIFRAVDEMRNRISCLYLGSVIRTRPESEALALLRNLEPWYDRIAGFGMGGAERGNPPSRFAAYFRECRKLGFKTTVHAGEEGPAEYVREALELLHVDRIDHGNAAVNDPALMRDLAECGVPLTMCPVSNLRLNVIRDIREHPLKLFLDAGIMATVNSDDPAYFRAYASDNRRICAESLELTDVDLAKLAENGIRASFLPENRKQNLLKELYTKQKQIKEVIQ